MFKKAECFIKESGDRIRFFKVYKVYKEKITSLGYISCTLFSLLRIFSFSGYCH